jgi:hydrogenase maturation protein HypF
MAEHKLDGAVIGLAFDGTGYGTDGSVWGGEILIAEKHTFKRAGHLAYVAMPGSSAAIKEPWRMAISYLRDAYGADFYNLDLPFLRLLQKERLTVVGEMIDKKINSPPTSSLGRFFDGIASICGIRSQVSFEGQAAMELEMLSAESAESCYAYEWHKDNHIRIFTAPIVRGVVSDIQNKIPLAEIGAKFHRTLICLFSDLCCDIRGESGLNRVVLSGGCFQNAALLSGISASLQANNFEVFTNEQVPTNDGGISLGQAVVAAARAHSA